jgi:hypothetical protein
MEPSQEAPKLARWEDMQLAGGEKEGEEDEDGGRRKRPRSV